MSYGLIDDRDRFELYVLFWCCPKVPSVRRTHEGFTLEGLHYFHYSLIVGGYSDRSLHPSKGIVCLCMGVKRTCCLMVFNVMVGFMLMISSSCGCLLEVQS